ncbi:MAG TPA: hypothetical protein VMV06_08560 [Acidimicrobiales bacterium]|nr:hypothetical protein [Acidimicrobiales bacterium]HVB93993.1 hypothetical protein [Acidimicrobiales bacterium]
MRSREKSSSPGIQSNPENQADGGPTASDQAAGQIPSAMAVSIAGVSRACSKDALVSSAKAVREALQTE